MDRYAVGVDLGGTKVEACLVDGRGTIVTRKRIASQPHLGRARVVENILRVIVLAAGRRSFEAVGIGTPGTYCPAHDTLYGAPHSPTYEQPGLIGELRERLPVPLQVENDANCLALGEFFYSCAGRYRSVMAVILGTGVGSGLILDGRLFRGSQGNAGEIGHVSIDPNGRMCQCGRRGCVEAYLSGPSLSRRFAELTGLMLQPEEIFARCRSGDAAAEGLFAESCQIMAETFANLVNVLDLEAIILGGGVSNLPVWYEQVGPLLERSLFGIPDRRIPIIKAGLGDSAGVLGAAYLGLRQMGLMEF